VLAFDKIILGGGLFFFFLFRFFGHGVLQIKAGCVFICWYCCLIVIPNQKSPRWL
jgi:hypothetical protein